MMGWTRDLEAVTEQMLETPHIDPSRIIILGFSEGGAAAIHVAADNPKICGLAVAGAPAGLAQLSIVPHGLHRLRSDPRCIELIKEWVLDILGWKT